MLAEDFKKVMATVDVGRIDIDFKSIVSNCSLIQLNDLVSKLGEDYLRYKDLYEFAPDRDKTVLNIAKWNFTYVERELKKKTTGKI